jgi:hypothetical protein
MPANRKYSHEDLTEDIKKKEPDFEGFQVADNYQGLIGTIWGFKFQLTLEEFMRNDIVTLPIICLYKIDRIKQKLDVIAEQVEARSMLQ